MDPPSSTTATTHRRLPRARGDGPYLETCEPEVGATAPRTRGWTPAAPVRARWRLDCPAHAGMDPSACRRRGRGGRLPRARGDGPPPYSNTAAWCATAPRTRGWTPTMLSGDTDGLDCPAHAGMDRWRSPGAGWRCRLPRARGDGPCPFLPPPPSRSTAPRTRGWTLVQPEAVGVELDCPAHAGMDRSTPASQRRSHGLPRARGDGPCSVVPADCADRTAPRTRGWTHSLQPRPGGDPDCPAHAGMDPLRQAQYRVWDRLPRARGDGPVCDHGRAPLVATAPRTRGWTLSRSAPAGHKLDCPAHAGMDPDLVSVALELHGLPRARGDGPGIKPITSSARPTAPRTRGWTPALFPARRMVRDCPAHAGMDPCFRAR